MFKIVTKEGVELGYTEKVRYIKLNKHTGCFNACTKEEAIGVALNSNPYNLFGHEEIPGVETVLVVEVDAGAELNKLTTRCLKLTNDLAQTDEAAIELYEAHLMQEITNAEQDEAIIEIYELMGEIKNG